MASRLLSASLAASLATSALFGGFTPRLAQADECGALAPPRSGPLPFPVGETLRFNLDVNGVRAGQMTFDALPRRGTGPSGTVPVRIRLETNTFFRKVRDAKADIRSTLRASTLLPVTFTEQIVENGVAKNATVQFPSGAGPVKLDWTQGSGETQKKGSATFTPSGAGALDYVGALAYLRSIPLKVGDTYCFEVYAMKRLWRVEGRVAGRESVTAPVGVFNAFHLTGTATRLGPGKELKRELHLWISDDDKRLPLAAVGTIDLGTVRATLSKVTRPDLKADSPRTGDLEW